MKRETAYKMAISALEDKRRRLYAVGNAEYQRGSQFLFAEKDSKKYKRISQAIEILEKEIGN